VRRQTAPGSEARAAAGRNIAGWGAFCTALSVVVLFVAGASWTLALAVGALAASGSTVVWVTNRNDRTA
jgi:hypothetical protein